MRTRLRYMLVVIACIPSAQSAEEPALEWLNATLWVQTSVEYRASARQAYELAKLRLDQALADPTWTAALEQKAVDPKARPAVILDVDETVLSNLPFEGELIRRGGNFSPALWKQWVSQAAAEPIPGALDFCNYAKRNGVTVFYVTNRKHEDEAGTRLNLERREFPLAEDMDVLLTKNERKAWASDKTTRRAHVASTHRILLLIGDDFNDFVSGAKTPMKDRAALSAKHAGMWGTKWIVIPNPMYGSWDAATCDYDRSLSSSARRSRKLGLLAPFEGGRAP